MIIFLVILFQLSLIPISPASILVNLPTVTRREAIAIYGAAKRYLSNKVVYLRQQADQ